MDIKTLSIEQLKALAFDEINIRDNAVHNISILISEIQSRQVPKESDLE